MTIAQGMLMGILLMASLQDHEEMSLPNLVPGFAAVIGLLSLATGLGVSAWDGLLGGLAGGGLFLLIAWGGSRLFGQVALGGADIKMMFAIGLFLGWKLVLVAAMAAYVAGAVIGIYGLLSRTMNRKASLPFIPAMLVGTWLAIFYGENLVDSYARLVF